MSEKATNLITGILADNAGWQSITAGDMSGTAKSVVAKGEAMAMKVGGGALKIAGGLGFSALGLGAKVGLKGAAGVGLGLGYGAYYAGKGAAYGAYYAGKGAAYGAYGMGKAAFAGGKALANKISAWRNGGSGGNAEGGNTGNVPLQGGTADTGTQQQTGPVPQNQHDTGGTQQQVPNGNGNNGQNNQTPPTGQLPQNQHDTGGMQQAPNGNGGNGQNDQANRGGTANAGVDYQRNVGSFAERLAKLDAHMRGVDKPKKSPPISVQNQKQNP